MIVSGQMVMDKCALTDEKHEHSQMKRKENDQSTNRRVRKSIDSDLADECIENSPTCNVRLTLASLTSHVLRSPLLCARAPASPYVYR